ncbi:MAG: DUF4177 domain-containing protein [Sphingobacteriales bacterium]|nr:DUF4177 domain-containing protein [Sphingobacteriales bacterium]
MRTGGIFSSGGKFNFQEITNSLNDLGKAGWEVVGCTDINRYGGTSKNIMIILKRPINDNE